MHRTLHRRDLLRLAAAASAGAVLTTSGLTAASAAPPPLAVTATTSMIADALRVIGADRVAVTALMGEGVDPHTYRQTRSDIATMVRSDAVFRHGLYLEAQLEDFFETLQARVPVLALAEAAIPVADRLAHDAYENRFDPHVWMDPSLWVRVVRQVAEELSSLEPDSAAAFRERAEAYAVEIAALGHYSARVLETVPADARVLITAHDAFNYFGRAYDFEVLGIQGLSTESEAGLAEIERLVSILVDRRISAIFVESSVSDRNVKALVEGAAARGHRVAIGGQIYSDAMGRPGTYEGTYLGMIDHNVTLITRALGGDAPVAGFRGRLDVVN